MKKRTRRLLGVSIVLLCVSIWTGYRYMQHANRASAIATTLEWGQLAPFPETAQQFTIITEGSPFTRAFRVQFVAPPDAIDAWLRASPGIGATEGETRQPYVRYFRIVPGGGAQGAEVEVDDATHTVKVYVYWS